MKQIIKKLIWYIIMCLSGFVGAYILYHTMIQNILSDENMARGNVTAGYGLLLLLKYPILYIMIIIFLFIGIVGFVCIDRKEKADFRLTHQRKLEIILYNISQIFLLICMLNEIFERNICGFFSMLLLSVCSYTSAIWIGNIHNFLCDIR